METYHLLEWLHWDGNASVPGWLLGLSAAGLGTHGSDRGWPEEDGTALNRSQECGLTLESAGDGSEEALSGHGGHCE
jgi:hypothetical protein